MIYYRISSFSISGVNPEKKDFTMKKFMNILPYVSLLIALVAFFFAVHSYLELKKSVAEFTLSAGTSMYHMGGCDGDISKVTSVDYERLQPWGSDMAISKYTLYEGTTAVGIVENISQLDQIGEIVTMDTYCNP